MTTPYNTDLMIQVREHIAAHPERHDQASWGRKSRCGTTHCIAGWAAALNGAKLEWTFALLRTADDQTPDDYAQKALGLTEDETSGLFYTPHNATALDLLDRMIEAGKNGERAVIEFV